MNKPGVEAGSAPRYVLGHSDQELERLGTQARLIDPITRSFFRTAGIAAGMRVLDVGSGAGDVAFIAADLVGSTGEVVGVDRASAALVTAAARADARSLRNVTFREGDAAEMKFERPFDAVIGRFVLQFQRDASALLRRLAALVRPGGVIAFQESDWDGARSLPRSETYDRCCRWVVETLRLGGAETRMGSQLHSKFVAAGLPPPSMRLEAVIGGGAKASDALQLVVDLVRTQLPSMERLGVATAAEVDLPTLAERARSEAIANSSLIQTYSLIGAWCHV
jgi:SAM-dependent methyltransferase